MRYLVSGWVQNRVDHPFPHGVLLVNLLGCLLIGLLGGLAETRGVPGQAMRLFLLVGMFGGFTTFSAFGYDTLELVRSNQLFLACSNVALHIVLGLAAVWLGFRLATAG